MKDNNSQIISGQDNIKKLALHHFNQLYSDSGEKDPLSQANLLSVVHPSISEEENKELEKPIIENEIIEPFTQTSPQDQTGS